MAKLDYNQIFTFIFLVFSIVFFISFVSATSCWLYNSASTCTSGNGCKWTNDSWGSSCNELNCWNLYTQSECSNTAVSGKNCTWKSGGVTYGCEKLSCWSLSGTSEASCVNNSANLNCQWGSSCYPSGGVPPSVNCMSLLNQSSCLNTTGCAWGSCSERSCGNYLTNITCKAAKDFNGKNCTWNNDCSYCEQSGCWKYNSNSTYCINNPNSLSCQWKYSNCQDVDCYAYDYTNASACINNSYNLTCTWGGSYCQKQDCWTYNSNATCSQQSNCMWKSYVSSGWCQQVECWTWDSVNSGNKTSCENNDTLYGLDCLWNGNPSNSQTNGWCYKNIASVSCSNLTTERACMDTFYCWWQYNNWTNLSLGGTCTSPGNFGGSTINTTIFNEWNPGCYIFDMNVTDCNNTIGCNYSSGKCRALDNDFGRNITANGLNCSYINSSNLCNSLPVLSTCCIWQDGVCATNKFSTSCRDQMQTPPDGAAFCEDYSSYENEQLCNQIAGSPWYMPCEWQNSSSRCKFKSSDVFGNGSQSLTKIENKKSCEAAGGKWITENYCEGNVSVPSGRCEYKFDEEYNCDKACFACEIKDSNGNSVNSTSAASACYNSKLGICEFTASAIAPNGVGYCKAKEQFKKGIAGDCDSNCGDCTFKGNPTSNDTTKRPVGFCSNSKANAEGGGCKWITDNSTATGGYCVNKGEKTCEDSCDRCKTQDSCSNIGRTIVANQSGSCKWQGGTTSTTGNCVANIAGNVEICWNGADDNDDNLIDCADPSCYADTFCGFVLGDCFGWTDNTACIAKDCEWIADKWGSWCDFKGSQCWKYTTNSTFCNNQTNCQWSNGTGGSWCEQDWSKGEVCMGKNIISCAAANASGCNWTVDTWCSGSGNGTSWCNANGGWCDYLLFKPKNCWMYSGSSECSSHTGCSWKSDQYQMPHCEVNWSIDCSQFSSSISCNDTSNCIWEIPSQGGGWCINKANKCGSYNQSTCKPALDGRCYWQSWGSGNNTGGSCQSMCWNGSININEGCSSLYGCVWKAQSGWCEESSLCSNSSNMNNENACGATDGCRWKQSGYCDPKGGGFSSGGAASGGGVGTAMGADCYKYDGNRSYCTNKTIINISCGWTINPGPSCEVDWSKDCWRYSSVASGCTSNNGCWFKNDSINSYCTNAMDQCWQNQTLQSSSALCNATNICQSNSWGGCEPKCSSKNETTCNAGALAEKCRWNSGWCNPKGMNDMFESMESGAPAPLAFDGIDLGLQASVDMVGCGIKDMGDSYGFGSGVNDFSNASICNKEKLSSFVMGQAGGAGGGVGAGVGMNFGQERTGSGNDTVIYLVYLDTDGSTTGSCSLSHNSSANGYEFRFKYSSVWSANTSKAVETFNADICENSAWEASDIKISAWKRKMCSDIGGPIIAIKKADLSKYPTLYDSTRDIRVYTATIGNTGNVSSPSDSCGPGWTTPGSIDFEIKGAFEYGADSAKFEDILKNGFVKGEDCFNSIDDDGDGNVDCSDWDCQYSGKCSERGVNIAGYSDTTTPLVTGVMIEEYPDSALIIYDTNKPANGTLELYNYGDTQCLNRTYIIYDIGILSLNVRDYKLWHTALIYDANDTNISLNWPLATGSTYNYKIKVCDSNNKCAISKCSSFTLPSVQKCVYCNFVTRIKTTADWKVAYDVDRDGNYEHMQGEVCGPNAGIKTNYTLGRKVNVKLYKSDESVYIEFLNASLTKTGLNDKVRTISASGDVIYDTTKKIFGLSSETRDKIINNLHPEVCRVKIPVASGATCDRLYHCDDNGENCVDRTSSATLVNSATCLWQIPYCEFSTYKTSAASSSPSSSSSGGGGGGGAATYTPTEEEFIQGYTKELIKSDQFKVNISGVYHYVKLISLTSIDATINVSSKSQIATLAIGETRNFDVSEDGKEDLIVTLNSINSTAKKASFSIKKPVKYEAGITGGVTEGIEEHEEQITSGESGKAKEKSLWWLYVLVIVVLVVVLFVGLRIFKKRKILHGF